MNPKLKVLAVGIGIIMLIVIGGYLKETQQNNKSINNSLSPFFPVQSKPSEFSMTALLKGELVLDENGCIRVKHGNDNYLLVWPYGFSLRTEGGAIQIVDSTGKPVARVGDIIEAGGGECVKPCRNIAKYSAQLPSERCSGPYWIVGQVIKRD